MVISRQLSSQLVQRSLQFQMNKVGGRCMATAAKSPAALSETHKDFYTLLGIAPEATPTEIREAFYRQARVCHPDARPNDKAAAAKFLAVKEAYTTLSDSSLRHEYDKVLFGAASGSLGDHESAARRAVVERESAEAEAAALNKLKEDMEVQMKTRQAIAPERVWTWKHEKRTRRFNQVLRTPGMIAQRYGGGPKEKEMTNLEKTIDKIVVKFTDDEESETNTNRMQSLRAAAIIGLAAGLTILAYFSSTDRLKWVPRNSPEYQQHMKDLGFQTK